MKAILASAKGKLALLTIFYIPFFSALFFRFFEGNTYESPIGGCCLSMQGLVAAAYILITIWVIAPCLIVYLIYRATRK